MKTTNKLHWLWLVSVSLMAVLAPLPVLAQGEKPSLNLYLLPAGYNNELKASQDNKLFLEIGNTGNTTINGIRLSSQGPDGWTIKVDPSEIRILGAGSVQTVALVVNPGSRAAKGGYTINVIAEANEISRVTGILVYVKSSSALWVWLGAIIAAVVIAVFVIIFMRSGRQ